MTDPIPSGTVARIRIMSRNGGPLTWVDPVNGPVSLYPGEAITIGNPAEVQFGVFDYYWFTSHKLSKPMVISSWQFTPLSDCGDGRDGS